MLSERFLNFTERKKPIHQETLNCYIISVSLNCYVYEKDKVLQKGKKMGINRKGVLLISNYFLKIF